MRADTFSSPGHDRSARGRRPAARNRRLPGIATLAATLLALAGCTSPPPQASDRQPGYGDSLNQNAAVMIIDPQPARAIDTALDLDGHRAEIAIIRYYTHTVIPPEALTTSALGGVPGSAAVGAAAATAAGAMQ